MSSLNCPSRLCCMAVTAVSLGFFSLSEGHLHVCPHTRGKYCVVDLPVCCQCSVPSFLQCLFISKKKLCSGKSVECWTFTDNPFHALCNHVHVYRYIMYHLFSHLCLYILQVGSLESYFVNSQALARQGKACNQNVSSAWQSHPRLCLAHCQQFCVSLCQGMPT